MFQFDPYDTTLARYLIKDAVGDNVDDVHLTQNGARHLSTAVNRYGWDLLDGNGDHVLTWDEARRQDHC